MKSSLSAENRLELIHVSLMRDPTFALYAGLFMVGSTTVIDADITARTNGRDCQYGRKFIASLSDKELAFLVMHENSHKAYRHLTVWRGLYEEDHELANASADHVINLQLVELDPRERMIAFPLDPQTGARMGCYDKRFTGLDTHQVFDILKEEKRKDKGDEPEEDEPPPGDEPEGDGPPCDKPPGDKPKRDKPEGDKPAGDGPPGDKPAGDGPPGGKKQSDKPVGKLPPRMDEHDWEGAKDMGEEKQKAHEREVDQALRQGSIYAGKVGGTISRAIGELLLPQVNWREVLRRFARTSIKDRDSVSWRRAHRNYLWQDIILPSVLGKRVKSIIIAMDTSGSVQGTLLDAFMSEMEKVLIDCKPDRVDIIYWDAVIQSHEIYISVTAGIMHKTSPKGGGGTDPNVVVDYIREKSLTPDCLVVLTDGYMSSDKLKWAGFKPPTLWCVIGNETYEPPIGQKVNITKD